MSGPSQMSWSRGGCPLIVHFQVLLVLVRPWTPGMVLGGTMGSENVRSNFLVREKWLTPNLELGAWDFWDLLAEWSGRDKSLSTLFLAGGSSVCECGFDVVISDFWWSKTNWGAWPGFSTSSLANSSYTPLTSQTWCSLSLWIAWA